ncbi:hypothetical protein [Rhizobium sp. C4]|uniref:hypothetical protein n=1 Tax=Rhizobium sp. C4 TaxID=1349800 RepID=UPI001E4A2EFE|nr:hypothetical protein [Rhizobium sp. C4]MCD2175996.1 hypothetical protein [Rhizobium sp. C4]
MFKNPSFLAPPLVLLLNAAFAELARPCPADGHIKIVNRLPRAEPAAAGGRNQTGYDDEAEKHRIGIIPLYNGCVVAREIMAIPAGLEPAT